MTSVVTPHIPTFASAPHFWGRMEPYTPVQMLRTARKYFLYLVWGWQLLETMWRMFFDHVDQLLLTWAKYVCFYMTGVATGLPYAPREVQYSMLSARALEVFKLFWWPLIYLSRSCILAVRNIFSSTAIGWGNIPAFKTPSSPFIMKNWQPWQTTYCVQGPAVKLCRNLETLTSSVCVQMEKCQGQRLQILSHLHSLLMTLLKDKEKQNKLKENHRNKVHVSFFGIVVRWPDPFNVQYYPPDNLTKEERSTKT